MNENMNINFDDGSQKVTINGDPERYIKWYPNDVNFIDRFFTFEIYVNSLADRLKSIKGIERIELDREGKPIGESDEYEPGSFERLGEEFRAELDKFFGSPVSEAAFGKVNPISPTAGGGFVYENFINAIIPLIEKSFETFEISREKYTSGAQNRAARRAANKK